MTIRYLLNGSGGTDSDLTPAVGNNEQALTSTTNTTAITRTIPTSTTDEISLSWSTAASNPNEADWANGTYHFSVNISSVDANVTIKGQLLRVNSSGTIQETLINDTTGVTTAGVYTQTVDTDPSAGSAGDRFQLRLLGSNSNTHNTRSFTVTIDSTSWIEGTFTASSVSIAAVCGASSVAGVVGT